MNKIIHLLLVAMVATGWALQSYANDSKISDFTKFFNEMELLPPEKLNQDIIEFYDHALTEDPETFIAIFKEVKTAFSDEKNTAAQTQKIIQRTAELLKELIFLNEIHVGGNQDQKKAKDKHDILSWSFKQALKTKEKSITEMFNLYHLKFNIKTFIKRTINPAFCSSNEDELKSFHNVVERVVEEKKLSLKEYPSVERENEIRKEVLQRLAIVRSFDFSMKQASTHNSTRGSVINANQLKKIEVVLPQLRKKNSPLRESAPASIFSTAIQKAQRDHEYRMKKRCPTITL